MSKILEEEEIMLVVEVPRSRIGLHLDIVAIKVLSKLDLTLVPITDISID